MLKMRVLVIFVVLLTAVQLSAQLKRFYNLSDPELYDTVTFELHATSGISFIRPVTGGNPLTIFGNPNLEHINPSYSAEINNRHCLVLLDLKEYKTPSLGKGLAFAMLSSKSETEENYWKSLINDRHVYFFDLNFGIGSSDIDLSGTAVRQMAIKTGSADVTVSYAKNTPNKIRMDTFMVKVDLGSLFARDLSLARAKEIIAEIGFGQAMLDFSEIPMQRSHVTASVGAGKLDVVLPQHTPMLIKIKSSPLCGVTLPDGFEEVEKNVYLNMLYQPHAENLLTFDINVTMGTVNFAYAD